MRRRVIALTVGLIGMKGGKRIEKKSKWIDLKWGSKRLRVKGL